MKSCILTIIGVLVASHVSSAQPASETWTKRSKISYGIGRDIGRTIKSQDAGLDIEALVRGLQDAVFGASPAVADSILEPLLEEYGREMVDRQTAKARELGEQNQAAGEAFVEKCKKEQNFIPLQSGVLYKVLKMGNGPKPTIDKTVVCHYRGTLIDGTEFDSSYKRNEATTFPIRNVIKGWQEILPMMPVGSKWQVVIPPHMAYGERGAGDPIGPNTTLIFEIELLSVK